LVDEHQLLPHVLAEIVERFGDRPDSTPGVRARFPLRHCVAVARVQREHGVPEPVAIEVVDLSVGGLGFKAPVLLPAGSLLTVELRVPGVLPQAWRCRVTSIHAFDGTYYHAGARFEAVGAV
jgi:hypothetical protein